MNIPPLIAAVESLDEALIATIDPNDRKTIEAASESLRNVLKKHGVFLGTSSGSLPWSAEPWNSETEPDAP